MLITSVQNNLIKQTVKLHQKKYRDEAGLFVVDGYHLYEEARKVGAVKQVFTTDESIVGDDVIYVSSIVMEKLAQTKHTQGILTVCFKVKNRQVDGNVLLLDHIQDPGNLGTLMRSALAFGFTTIVLDGTVDVYNDKVLRSTQGALFKLNIVIQDIPSFMEENYEHTYFGTSMNGTTLRSIKAHGKIGLVLGNEGAGLDSKILELTHTNITIPMQETESLNVGVAGSIIMYHFTIG